MLTIFFYFTYCIVNALSQTFDSLATLVQVAHTKKNNPYAEGETQGTVR